MGVTEVVSLAVTDIHMYGTYIRIFPYKASCNGSLGQGLKAECIYFYSLRLPDFIFNYPVNAEEMNSMNGAKKSTHIWTKL